MILANKNLLIFKNNKVIKSLINKNLQIFLDLKAKTLIKLFKSKIL